MNENGMVYHSNDKVGIKDCSWNRDGTMFVISDSNGRWSLYGTGTSTLYDHIPPEVYFPTDYEPFTYTKTYNVIDTATKLPSHMLPKIYCEVNGAVYNNPPPHPLAVRKINIIEDIKMRKSLIQQTKQLEYRLKSESDILDTRNTNVY